MFILFTDFGDKGPYVGQMEAVLRAASPGCDIVRLMSDAPVWDPRASAYLLAALGADLPENAIVLAVVDPGVGSDREACVLRIGSRWFVGPDNGVLAMIARHAQTEPNWFRVTWRPRHMSASFHGRDLFAPLAAQIASGDLSGLQPVGKPAFDAEHWPDDWPRVIYIDDFGNAMTGVRASTASDNAKIIIGEKTVCRARTFSDVPVGEGFWYENALKLVEIAVNCGRADKNLSITRGASVKFIEM